MLKAQSVKVPIHVISGKKWVQANNEALDLVEADYFLRVDDDMFLHPRALEFMLHNHHGHIAHTAKLYEHWAKRVGGKVRLYNRHKVKAIGGFRPNALGKIDRTFARDAQINCHRITTVDKHSPVGIHACGTLSDQKRYQKLWGYKKPCMPFWKQYHKTVGWQASHAIKLIEKYNKREGTVFWGWLGKSRS